MSGREAMLIEVDPASATDIFVDYLGRLGCSVERRGHGRVSALVTFPATVDDEARSLREWCESWSQAGRTAFAIDMAAVS
jgi:galactose-1-phosphate uridylyltransferase